jgi:hypothetical protein
VAPDSKLLFIIVLISSFMTKNQYGAAISVSSDQFRTQKHNRKVPTLLIEKHLVEKG